MSVHEPFSLHLGVAAIPRQAADRSLEKGALRLSGSLAKRVIDLFGATLSLAVLLPLLALIALALALESGAWPIFRQERTGLHGAKFVIYKFRTMRVCEERGAVRQAVRHDPRVTAVGLLLRRTSLDELPQLWNVLKGDMSLVGPRPHVVAHDVHYGALIPGYYMRYMAKPGLSGLAQVSGFRGRTPQPSDMAHRVAKDLEYIRRWSIWLDLTILLRTPLVLAFHPMAY